jgi:hypothetical protein
MSTYTVAMPQKAVASTFTSVRGEILQRQCACGQHTGGGECTECRQKREGTLQRAAVTSSPTTNVSPVVHEALSSPGQPLDADTRTFMEPRFGHDFSDVRVHTDGRAAESARSVNALAYTVGRNIVFDANQYSPTTMEGRRLMAHELTHVVQQGSQHALQSKLEIGAADDPFEREADSVATHILDISTSEPNATTASNIQQVRGGAVQAARLQRSIGDGHDLSSPRFAGDPVLEACYDNERLLRGGDPDKAAITKIQQALVDAGFPLPKFGVDGLFGDETKAAVEDFQRASGLTGRDVDGIIGPITMGLLDKRFPGGPVTPPSGPVTPSEPRKVPTLHDLLTLKPGVLLPGRQDQQPEISVQPGILQDVTQTLPPLSPPEGSSLVEVTTEVTANLKLFSIGDKPDPNQPPDPCRVGETELKLNTKFKLDGIGIGKKVHLLYHGPTLSVSTPGPCQKLPEFKSETDLLNAEIIPKVLEFSLKPGLTIAEGQLKPGLSTEVEIKPWGRASDFRSKLKFSFEVEGTSEKKEGSPERIIKIEGKLGVGAEF